MAEAQGKARVTGEERITVRLALKGGAVGAVEVDSSRGGEAARVLENQPLPQAVALAPLLFSLCGQAQGVAAQWAAAAAQGSELPMAGRAGGLRRVQAEAVQEHVWRVLVDWPQWLDEAPDMAALAEIRRDGGQALGGDEEGWESFCAGLDAFLARRVLGMPPRQWLGMATPQALRDWAEEGATPAARLVGRLLAGEGDFGASGVDWLPPADGKNLLATVEPEIRADPEYPRYPTWQGEPRETGPLARTRHVPLVARLLAEQGGSVAVRFVARLLELAQLAGWLRRGEGDWLGQVQVSPGVGMAWAETARGLLVHWIEAEQGRVKRYRIVAPTEWNFHPHGPLVRGLAGTAAVDEEEARRKALWLVQALDPCVACAIEVYHA